MKTKNRIHSTINAVNQIASLQQPVEKPRTYWRVIPKAGSRDPFTATRHEGSISIRPSFRTRYESSLGCMLMRSLPKHLKTQEVPK